MKKIFFFSFFTFLIVILSMSKGKAQWVTIPDANFVAWLQANYPSCMNGNLMDTTCSGIVNEISLNLSSQNIVDLNGIQYFDNLDTLNISNDPLIGTIHLPPALVYLSCSLSDPVIPFLPNTLNYLDYSENYYALPSLPSNLKFLIAHSYSFSLPALPSSLEYLDVMYFQYSTLTVVAPSLKYLNCSYSVDLTHISEPLPDSLIDLNIEENTYLDSVPLIPSKLVNLNCFDLSINHLPSLPSTLRNLNIDGTNVTELPPLPDTLNSLHALCCLSCLPPLKYFSGGPNDFTLYLDSLFCNSPIGCLPNYIQHNGYIPLIDNLPVCDFNYNPNGCEFDWNILGDVVYDADGSCATLNDSTALKNMKVKLFDGSSNLLGQEITTPAGSFSFTTSNGAYSVSVDTANVPFNVICPSSNNISGVITVIDSTDTGLQFRMVCKPGFDLGAWNVVRTHRFFPLNITSVSVFAGDFSQAVYGTSCDFGVSGEVKVVIAGPANYVSPLAGALTPIVNGDTLIYIIPDFSLVNTTTDFAFNVLTDSTAQIGDAICFDVSVTPTAGDNNISNNTLTHCFEVSNSYDPNEKEVSPIGDLNYPFNNWLTYTIHFQNTGTAAAQHIQILDTLDTDLDESTFQLLSSSFDPMVQLFGSKVHFNFVNINLPDSGSNAEGSKGYVSYRIKPKQNLAIGTEIENTASIYFDFNSPVVTNTTLNTIVHDNGVSELAVGYLKLAVYPNPASNQLTIDSKQLPGATIFITDIFGRELLRVKANLTTQIINLKSFPSGFYFVKVQMQNGEVVVRKFIKASP